jgi:hypothetical protein
MDENGKKQEVVRTPMRINGRGVGCCLGAIAAPILFIAFLEIYYLLEGDFDAEGVPFFFLMSIPSGAVAGAVLWPVVIRVGAAVTETLKRKIR